MNTNWAKILLFTLLGFALGHIVTYLAMGRHGHGCGDEMSCHGAMAACGHHGEKMKGSCCSGHAMGHDMHPGDEQVQVIVKDLKDANFQGDTTIAIEGGTVNVTRNGDSTMVQVEMRKVEKEVAHEHSH